MINSLTEREGRQIKKKKTQKFINKQNMYRWLSYTWI